MRSRTGTSAINRRKYTSKVTKKTEPSTTKKPVAKTTTTKTTTTQQPTKRPSPQPTKRPSPQKTVIPATQQATQRIVPASTGISAAGISTAGIAVAAPGAAERQSGGRPVSSTIDGREIKVDEEGRMSLDEIKKMNFIEQLFRGGIVPTEQMVGVAKDVAYGVASEDQRMMESGLDLVLNPLMKPYVDPSMKEQNVISEEWYWPEELKANWNVLPSFMQKSEQVETRSFIEGASANVGNIGAITQSPLAGKIRDEEFAVSGERFAQAPGYYVGSALGEIPYFIIGAGQVKAVGTVAAKATAGVVRGGGVINTAKVMSVAYKIERATEKLQKVANKADNVIHQSKIVSRPEVLRAVKLLKDGYAMNVRAQTKTAGMSKAVKSEAVDVSRKLKLDSKTLNKFTADKMDKIEALPEKTSKQRLRKKIKIDEFNADVQEHLLPDMRKFKDGYVAQAAKTASNTKVEKLATAIGGSPKDMSKRLDNYFNKRRSDLGDTDKTNEQFFRDQMSVREAQGDYAGVMGNIKFNRDLFGNTMNTALGINRTQKKAKDIISLVQRSIPSLRIVTKDQLLGGVKAFEDYVKTNKEKIKVLELKNKGLQDKFDKGKNVKSNRSRTGKVVEDDYDPVTITYTKNAAGEPIPNKPIKIKKLIANNKHKIDKLQKRIDVTEQTIKANKKEALRAVSYTRTKKDGTNAFRFDFEIFQKAYGFKGSTIKAEDILPEQIFMASKPSISVKKVRGRWQGQIGDTPKTSKSFFIDQIPRAKAMEIYGDSYVSKKPSVFKSIGLRKVGKYRTLVPKKAEPMEDIVYMYEATDSLRAAGFQKSGVKPILVMNAGISVEQKNLIKKEYGLDTFSGDPKVGQALSDGGERAIFEYKPIPTELIDEVKQGKAQTLDGQDLTDMLINRAELENRQEEFVFFADKKIIELDAAKIPLEEAFNKKLASVTKNKRFSKSTKDKKRKEAEAEFRKEVESIDDRQTSLRAKVEMSPIERNLLERDLQIHRTADQRGTVFSFPLQVLRRSSKNYKVKYEEDMVMDKRTGKEYYMSQAADGITDYYEVTDKSFRPSMVSNIRKKGSKPRGWDTMDKKRKRTWVGEQIKLSTKEFVRPTNIGPDPKNPFRSTGSEEFYIINVMEKGTRIKFVGSGREIKTWNKELNKYETQIDGEWVDAKDPNYQIGLDLPEYLQAGWYDDIQTKGIPDPAKGFVITNKKTGKVKWDEAPNEMTPASVVQPDINNNMVWNNPETINLLGGGKSIGQKSADEVKKVDQNTVAYKLSDKMRENLIFLDPDITIKVGGKDVPYEDMLRKLNPEEKSILEAGSTIGSKQAQMDRIMGSIKTTDKDLYLPDGRKLTEAEKKIWKKTGKLSTEEDAPTWTMGAVDKTTGQLLKQNVGIVTTKGIIRALQGVKDTKGKLRTKLFGENLIPLEVRDLAPDATTYTQFIERDVGRIPYGDAIRTTGFEDSVASLFVVSQSDKMVQGSLPGGVKVTPVQEAMSTSHVIKEKPLTAGQENIGKGLEANKGSNYDRMFAQAVNKDLKTFGGGTVIRDFKARMVEQIHTKILKEKKPELQIMNKYLDPDSAQYTKLIDEHVRTNNSNLKRMNPKEKRKLLNKNKGKNIKKAVINPDDFEDILGKVNLDRRNPIKRLSDAFKYRTQYRTEPEFFEGGTNYDVDGKIKHRYKPSKADYDKGIKKPSWFGRLATGVGEKRKNNYQVTENQNPFQIQALKEVFGEPWAQQKISEGTDKSFIKLYDSVMGMADTNFESSLQAVLKGSVDPANISKNMELEKLLLDLENTQLRLDKRLGPKNTSTSTFTLGEPVPLQNFMDANTNLQKIDKVKKLIAKNTAEDLTRQADVQGDIDWVNSYYDFDKKGNLVRKDPKPLTHWGKEIVGKDQYGKDSIERQPLAVNDPPSTTLFNISKDVWKSPGMKDQRIKLGPSETANLLDDFSTVEGGAFIKGTKPSPKYSIIERSLEESKDKTRGVLMNMVGFTGDSSTSASRRKLGKGIVNFMEESFEKSKQKQVKNVINTDDPVGSLSEYLAKSENTDQFNTPQFKAAVQKLETQQAYKQTTESGSRPRGVIGLDMDKFGKGIRSDNKPKPIGLKQQAPLASSLATSIGELFKPSETTATGQPQFELPSLQSPLQPVYAEKNVLEQTIGDIRKTISSVEAGNNKIGQGNDGTVKSYEMAQSLNIFGGSGQKAKGDPYGTSTMPDFSAVLGGQEIKTVPDLLSGLNLGQSQPQIESTKQLLGVDTFLVQGQSLKQGQAYKQSLAILPKPKLQEQLAPLEPVTPKPIPPRVLPIAPLFPLYDPGDPKRRPRRRYGKAKKKKTWWQTPENWWQPYYWGGKDQQGAGYVTFTGKEPAKVKKYEKKYFGIGVNDSPFGVRSKWF
jgi:hypothetical protein